ncbi:MAG: NAD(P)H-hydrate dehydratase [Candidatus Omnitrophota bacterium]|nr:NAD(P)H-hydrate dehydratase [Candidatus Omnitrophota bacterium]
MRLPTQLLRRRPDSHKGDFGHVFILAGSLRYSGAALLCAEACLRGGAGLVTLGVPEGIAAPLIKIKPKEVMTLPLPETKEGTLGLAAYKTIKNFIRGVNILVIGPGLSQNKSTQALVRKLARTAGQPMVIDADGLNALVGRLNMLRGKREEGRGTILTPHPGEMSRLLGISIKKVQNNRIALARKFAEDYKATVVLKGRNTVVADYKHNLYINKTGNPGMATAGSGDVLTGIIAAFLGQGLDAFSAAKYAVYLHGLAGDLAAKEKTQISLIASDIIAKIPEAIKRAN